MFTNNLTMTSLTRSGMYPQEISTYNRELDALLRADVHLTTVDVSFLSGGETIKMVTTMKAEGSITLENPQLITKILDQAATRFDDYLYFEKGVTVKGMVLDQQIPEKPKLLVNYTVDADKIHEWRVDKLQKLT